MLEPACLPGRNEKTWRSHWKTVQQNPTGETHSYQVTQPPHSWIRQHKSMHLCTKGASSHKKEVLTHATHMDEAWKRHAK